MPMLLLLLLLLLLRLLAYCRQAVLLHRPCGFTARHMNCSGRGLLLLACLLDVSGICRCWDKNV